MYIRLSIYILDAMWCYVWVCTALHPIHLVPSPSAHAVPIVLGARLHVALDPCKRRVGPNRF